MRTNLAGAAAPCLSRGAALLALAVIAGLAVASPATAQLSPDSAAQRCFEADTATRWKVVAMRWASGPDDHGTDPRLRNRLLDLARRDQELRSIPDLGDSIQSPTFGRRLARADSQNAAELMAIVRKNGWPTRTQVGVQGASAAFLVAQHNSHIQAEALRRMSALPPGEVSPADLAMLRDRILVRQGNPQIYATQLEPPKEGNRMVFAPILDLPHLDERRAEVGLPPLETYMCMLRGMYGKDVEPPKGTTMRSRPEGTAPQSQRPNTPSLRD